jgi:hypothetical protein
MLNNALTLGLLIHFFPYQCLEKTTRRELKSIS